MSKKWWIAAGFLVALAAGCNLPAPSTHCAPYQLVAPGLASPAMWEVVGTLSPTLTWTSTDPASSYPYPYGTCHPDSYQVTLADVPVLWGNASGITDVSITHWTPYSALLPGREYQWSVATRSDGHNGPAGGYRYFFTGPYCETAALVAPQLIGPPNGSLVDTLQPTLEWKYPNPCLPHGYRIDLSTTATFSDTSLSGGTGNPSTRWGPGSDLTNCTWYFWRVAPINDTTLGPYSITRTFLVNTGDGCVYPIPEVLGPGTFTPTSLPFILTSTPTPALPPEFVFKVNANCRKGPGPVYGVVTSYLAGQQFPVDGRNEAGTWLRLKINPNARCWVSIAGGDFNGVVNGLPVLADPPTPVPTVPTRAPTATPTKGRNQKP